ncbi:MAG TPA: 30S ribosomal protein S12 methylthiotransferase RimO [Candidatus Brocadiia bacterium]|nr:30S ribosomal protein S12 methylthiotransferase RimO [Candidatus Brocadiia bacterium]
MPPRSDFRVGLVNLGCPKNQIDGEKIMGALLQSGGRPVAELADADVIIVNTCGFIESAKTESIEAALNAATYRSVGSCRLLAIVGCLGQRYADELRKSMPEADIVCGIDRKRTVAAILKGLGLVRKRHVIDGLCAGHARLRLTPRHYAYLRIADGCDNRCAYCAIPLIRGPLRSRPPGEIMAEAEELAGDGARELILVAQDTTAYGIDKEGYPTIAELLRELAGIRQVKWLRLMYTHPASWTDELVREFDVNRRLLPYVDMPIQHASDRILKRMGRKTGSDAIRDIVEKLRNSVPEITLRTTVLVGFPGEEAADFRKLREFVGEMRFDRLGAFAYSREDGTRAHGMRDQIPERVKKRRLRDIMLAQQKIALELNRKRIGEIAEVVIDGPDAALSGYWKARSASEAPDVDPVILVRSRDILRAGIFMKARITATEGYDLVAEPVAE